jgi:CheY-like chemotaxis protein
MENKNDKILIVDDDLAVCRVLQRRLATYGFNPTVAYSGDQAIAMVENE